MSSVDHFSHVIEQKFPIISFIQIKQQHQTQGYLNNFDKNFRTNFFHSD